jgi:hypothetical protein
MVKESTPAYTSRVKRILGMFEWDGCPEQAALKTFADAYYEHYGDKAKDIPSHFFQRGLEDGEKIWSLANEGTDPQESEAIPPAVDATEECAACSTPLLEMLLIKHDLEDVLRRVNDVISSLKPL